jgi:hypothetical protein
VAAAAMPAAARMREAATTMPAAARMREAATTMPEAAMPTFAAMAGESAMRAGSCVPMPKAVTPPTIIPATEPATGVSVIAVTSGRVTNGLRASRQAKTDDDQQQYRSRPNSDAIHHRSSPYILS